MRVLVAGGAGFIGSWLCEEMVRRGAEVVCADNVSTGRASNIAHVKKDMEFVKADVSKKPLKVKGGVDFIYHLASPASPADYMRIPLETALANTIGTLNLLELARAKGAGFLLASTSEVYGDPERHPQREDYYGNVNTLGPRSCYDESKRFAETLSSIFSQKHGVDVKIARIFNTYGPRMREDDGRAVPNFITQALRGEALTIYGSGKQTRSFCYITDMVAGLISLSMSGEARGAFNLGSPDERKIIDIAKMIIKITGSESKVKHEEFPLDDPRKRRPDITKAREILGWEPRTGLEEGLKATINHFKEMGL